MKYKLIAIDMDGTLLNTEQEISKRNREALDKAAKQGVHLILATGRILKSALYYSKKLNLNNPIIASNGAIISSSDGKDIIYEQSIDYEFSGKVIELLEESKGFYNFYGKDTFYSKNINRGLEEQIKAYGSNLEEQNITMKAFKDPKEFLNENLDVYKFILIDEDMNKIAAFRKKLKKIKSINISSSWYNNVEVMKKGVSKGNALLHLCEKLDVGPSEVMAIGDNENDISMLELAGLSVAMDNSNQSVKEYSHIITDTNDEDGVAKAIEKYILK